MVLTPGEFLGPYKIIGQLGRGGMGEVYRAKDTRLHRDVAIKVLPEDLAKSEQALKRFEREARALGALSHPNIVMIHDVGTHQGISFVVMELLEGETLRVRLSNSALPWKEAVEIGVAVAEGLSAAHSKTVIHRDLKPENIFLTVDGRVKILDFGVAHKQEGDSMEATLTRRGTFIGTVPYMSPEQVKCESVDARSDVFSLGTLLYEMITGRQPFQRQTAAETMTAILKEDPGDLSDSRRQVPVEVKRIVHHCMEKNPEKRFQSARDLAFALKAVSIDSGSGRALTHEPRNRIVPVTILLVLLAFTGWWLINKTFMNQKPRDKSIAVLPFRNLSPDKDSEYFSNGITEDVLTQLSKIGDLRVISRTSIMRYKNTQKSLQEIGKELNVAHILEGSVRREGNQLRIVSQLIDAKTDEHIWAETYDREMKDVFAIQTDVALQIAEALRTKLSAQEQKRIEKKPTEKVTAYDYFLKARQYYGRYTKENNEYAIQLFEKAVEIDPKYALAYSSLGHCYMRRKDYGYGENSISLAIEACNKALALDPNQANAYALLYKIYNYKGWTQKAFDAIHKAAELDLAVGGNNLSLAYIDRAKFEESLLWINKVIVRDPANAFPYMLKGLMYYILDDLPKAERYLNKSLELQPDFPHAHIFFVDFYLAQDKYVEAKKHANELLRLDDESADNLEFAGCLELFLQNTDQAKQYFKKSSELDKNYTRRSAIYLAFLLLKEGDKTEAQKILKEREAVFLLRINQGSQDFWSRYNLAAVEAIKGNKKKAFQWLREAITAGDWQYRAMRKDPLFENLNSDPEFQQIIDELKGKVDSMRKKIERQDKLPL